MTVGHPNPGFANLAPEVQAELIHHELTHYCIIIHESQRQAIINALKVTPPDPALASNELELFSLNGLLDSFETLPAEQRASVNEGLWGTKISFVI